MVSSFGFRNSMCCWFFSCHIGCSSSVSFAGLSVFLLLNWSCFRRRSWDLFSSLSSFNILRGWIQFHGFKNTLFTDDSQIFIFGPNLSPVDKRLQTIYPTAYSKSAFWCLIRMLNSSCPKPKSWLPCFTQICISIHLLVRPQTLHSSKYILNPTIYYLFYLFLLCFKVPSSLTWPCSMYLSCFPIATRVPL